MPPRIIYLRNPTHGSHFRTISGSGSSSPRVPKAPRAPKPPKPGTPHVTGTTYLSSTGARYGAATPNWAIGNHPYQPNPTGTLPGYGIGPYSQEDPFVWESAGTFVGMMYDLVVLDIDPFSGYPIAPLGTPGTLKISASLSSLTSGRDWATAGDYWGYGGVGAKLPTRYWGAPTKNNRPTWLQWYEDHQ